MGYLLSAHRNQGVVRILGRLAIGSLSYWIKRITIITQECVICGMVYVEEQNLGDLDHPTTHPRANPTREHVDKDKDVQGLGFPNPAELKNYVTNPPAAVRFTVRCGLLYSLKQLKRACRTQHPPIYLRSMATRGEHVYQTFISLPPSCVHSPQGLLSTHSFTQALGTVCFSILSSGISH